MDKVILWDNDGVLVDTEYWYFKSTQRALSEIGVSLNKAEYLQLMAQGKPAWELARNAGVCAKTIASRRSDRDAYYQAYLVSEDIEIPGVLEALKTLSKTYRMGIVTTAKRRDFELVHDTRDIVAFMEFVIVREDYDLAKPEPEPYLLGLKTFGVEAKNCIAIEDSQRGLQSAVAAGMDCAVVHNEFTVSHDFSGAKYFVNALGELPEALGI